MDDVCEHFNMPDGEPDETVTCPNCKGKATFDDRGSFEIVYPGDKD